MSSIACGLGHRGSSPSLDAAGEACIIEINRYVGLDTPPGTLEETHRGLTPPRVGFMPDVIFDTFMKEEPPCSPKDLTLRVVVALDDSKPHEAMKAPTEDFDPSTLFIDTDEICRPLSTVEGMRPRILGFFQYHLDKHLQALAKEVASGAITPEAAMERLCTIFGPEDDSEIMRSAIEEHEEFLSAEEIARLRSYSRMQKALQDISNLREVLVVGRKGREDEPARLVHRELSEEEREIFKEYLPVYFGHESVREDILAYFNEHRPG